jgi:hypothetical protein
MTLLCLLCVSFANSVVEINQRGNREGIEAHNVIKYTI